MYDTEPNIAQYLASQTQILLLLSFMSSILQLQQHNIEYD